MEFKMAAFSRHRRARISHSTPMFEPWGVLPDLSPPIPPPELGRQDPEPPDLWEYSGIDIHPD